MLLAMSVTNLPRSGGTLFTTPDNRTINSTQRSKILVKNSNFFVPHLHFMPLIEDTCRNIAIKFGMEKLE